MDISKYTNANRLAWNEVQPYHARGRTIDLQKAFAEPGFSTLDPIITNQFKEIGLDKKRVMQLMCNNGREVLSMLNMGAASGLGFDIADAFVDEANGYAQSYNFNAKFVQSDVYAINPSNWEPADLLYISIGAFCWLPDMPGLFKIVAGLIKPGGHLVIYEAHPITQTLAFDDEPEFIEGHPLEAVHPYFYNKPWVYNDGIDYEGGVKYQSTAKYEFTHTLSSIINSVIQSGINIKRFDEYPHDISSLMDEHAQQSILPMSYILVGQKG